ncbi:carph-isopro domain-containing protein [Sphingomonas leidyi]|uniref:carph-isopro domain-containing protein n=1 Tax=Sphingomonas leidyi TaxID=68569 RepID=UPI0036D3BA75
MTQIENVLARFGSVRETADKLGRAPSVIQYWRKVGRIPANAQRSVLDAAERHNIAVTADELISRPVAA